MSKIEWTDETWNPVTGCDKVSPGCDNCYADRMAHRLQRMRRPKYADGFAVRTHENTLLEPSEWRKPLKVFVNSMSDLFHPKVPYDFIEQVMDTMGAGAATQIPGAHQAAEDCVALGSDNALVSCRQTSGSE